MAKPSLDSLMKGFEGGKEGGGKTPPSAPPTNEKAEPAATLSAAQRILAAVKAGDASALDDALQAHYAHCEDMDSEEDEEY